MVGQNGIKAFSLGLLLGSCLIGCVSARFGHEFFYPNFKSYEGTILGDQPSNDKPGVICAVDPTTKEHGCVIMLKADFEALYQEDIQLKNDLDKCQRGLK